MTTHIQKNTLSDLDSPVFAAEDELVEGTVQHKCEKGNEILYSDATTITFVTGENAGALMPGRCLFLREKDEYTLLNAASHAIVHRIMIDPIYMDDLLSPYEMTDIQMLVLDKQVSRLVCELFEELVNRKPYYEWVARGKLQEMHGYLCRNCKNDREDSTCKDTEVVSQILLYLRKNFKQKIHLDKLCTDIGYSKFYACHAFKKQMGQSIIGYANQLRCEYADRLLKSGKITLPAAGVRAGFSGTEQFLKYYEKLYGKYPDTTVKR